MRTGSVYIIIKGVDSFEQQLWATTAATTAAVPASAAAAAAAASSAVSAASAAPAAVSAAVPAALPATGGRGSRQGNGDSCTGFGHCLTGNPVCRYCHSDRWAYPRHPGKEETVRGRGGNRNGDSRYGVFNHCSCVGDNPHYHLRFMRWLAQLVVLVLLSNSAVPQKSGFFYGSGFLVFDLR